MEPERSRPRPVTFFPGGKNRPMLPPKIEEDDHHYHNPKKHKLSEASISERPQPVPALVTRISRPAVQITLLYKSPWIMHDPYITVEHSGSGIVAEKESPKGKLVFIKQVSNRKKEDLRALKSASHKNILALTVAYFHDDSIYLVYNYLPVTLKEVAQRHLTTIQIATICNAIMNGLDYLHRELGLTHGDLQMSNVVVGREGQIKIANVGESMLHPSGLSHRDDGNALSKILRALLEPMSNDDATDLIDPDACDATAVDLLQKLKFHDISTMLEPVHSFLEKAGDPSCLARTAFLAEEMRLRNVKVMEVPAKKNG